jgi:hypothetical protein
VGAVVTPWVKVKGQTMFNPGSGVRTVAGDGTFTWQRSGGKKMRVYFRSGEVRSNVVLIPARR